MTISVPRLPCSRQLLFGIAAGLLLAVLSAEVASAQGRSVRAVRRLSPIVLDGRLEEEAWASAAPAGDFVQTEPRQGEPASERTEVRVLFDGGDLYIGARCFDRDPSGIVANSLRPDFPPGEEDTFEVLLDTFSDSRGGVLFVTNPHGAKRDVQISANGVVQNEDWDAVWDVETRTTSDGWSLEMRIPFNALRYYSPVTRPWRINFGRQIRRRNESAYWAPVPRPFDITRVEFAGELAGMDGERLQPARNLWVKPYGTGRVGNADAKVVSTGDVGGDLKYGVTKGLTLDATVNADFAQVEVDNQIVSLDRFSIYFPEKREFFLENQGIFQIGTMGKPPDSLDPEDVVSFYSRRIGLSVNRNPVPILGGARLTGRVGAYQLGALSLETGAGDGQGRENASAFRVKRDLFARSEIGGFFLQRQGADRPTNQAYGVDAVLRPHQDLLFNLLHTRTRTPGVTRDPFEIRVETLYNTHWLRAMAVHHRVGAGYRNDLGFLKQTGVRVTRIELTPRIRPRSGGAIREFEPAYNVRLMTDEHGTRLIRKDTVDFGVIFSNGGLIRASARHYADQIQQDFRIQKNVTIPKGRYEYGDRTLYLTSDPSRRLSANATAVHGTFWDGHKTGLIVAAKFRPSARLSSELSLTTDKVELREGAFRTLVSRLRAGYAINTQAFLDAFVQYNNQDRRLVTNVRLNIIHHPLSDIFVVYTEDRPTDAVLQPHRVLSVKYTHLLAF